MRLCTFIGMALIAVFGHRVEAQPFQIRVAGPDVDLRTVATGLDDLQPVANTQARLLYRRASVRSRIIVETSCPGQSFSLLVEALDPSAGVASPPVRLEDGMAPMDLILDIPPEDGDRGVEQSRLKYTTMPTLDQGNSDDRGVDVHFVTYTVLAN